MAIIMTQFRPCDSYLLTLFQESLHIRMLTSEEETQSSQIIPEIPSKITGVLEYILYALLLHYVKNSDSGIVFKSMFIVGWPSVYHSSQHGSISGKFMIMTSIL